MDLKSIAALISGAQGAAHTVAGVTDLIRAGTELAAAIRGNVEEAAATLSETDAAVLRARADQLALENRALSEQLGDLLRGGT